MDVRILKYHQLSNSKYHKEKETKTLLALHPGTVSTQCQLGAGARDGEPKARVHLPSYNGGEKWDGTWKAKQEQNPSLCEEH